MSEFIKIPCAVLNREIKIAEDKPTRKLKRLDILVLSFLYSQAKQNGSVKLKTSMRDISKSLHISICTVSKTIMFLLSANLVKSQRSLNSVTNQF